MPKRRAHVFGTLPPQVICEEVMWTEKLHEVEFEKELSSGYESIHVAIDDEISVS